MGSDKDKAAAAVLFFVLAGLIVFLLYIGGGGLYLSASADYFRKRPYTAVSFVVFVFVDIVFVVTFLRNVVAQRISGQRLRAAEKLK